MRRITRFATATLAAVIGLSSTMVMTLQSAEALSTSQIKTAQTRLNYLGCNAGPVDGTIGMMTRAATVRFQAVMKIAQTGELDDPTYWRLGVSWRKRCDTRAVPSTSGGGRRMVLSQSQNYLWIIDSAGHVTAQGGMIDNPTYLKAGTYYTGPKCGRPGRVKYNHTEDGRLVLYNYVRFAPCGIGFHQIPYYVSSGQQIHPDYLLGTNYRQSHGCIRVSRHMSDVIWNFTTVTTRVVVVH
jgi:peptidoglycan hydrolase-like protein with peptidoglycan-binding domain